MKKLSKILILVFIFMFSFGAMTLAAPQISYDARIREDSDQIKVKVKLENIDSNQNRLYIDLPDLPEHSKDHDSFAYIDFLSDIKAYTDERDLEVNIRDGYLEMEYDPELTYFEYSIEKQIYNVDPFHPDQLIPVVYFTDEYGYFWSGFIFLIPDQLKEPSDLHVSFDTPEDWEVMAPFKKIDDYYAVEENEVISFYRNLFDSAFYMGKTEFIARESSRGTTHQIARLEADENEWELATQSEAESYMEKITEIYNYYVDLFDHNPYPVDLWRPNIKDFDGDTQISPGFGYMGNGWHYWPEKREFEITCHVVQSFISGTSSSPLMANSGIVKGFGEYYMGYLSAYEIFEREIDLGKLYFTYLVYERTQDDQLKNHYEYEFIRGFALAVYLDNKIREISYDNYNIKDVLSYLYDEYAMTDKTVGYPEVQEAIFNLTGEKMDSFFDEYVYNDKKIKAYQYVDDYKKYFEEMTDDFDEIFNTDLNGTTIPLFINIEMTLQNDQHIMSGMFAPNYMDEFADYIEENYDINELTEEEVEEALTELTGNNCSGFFNHWEESYGELDIDELREWLINRK
ncbi:MAG: hypothetical protein ACOCQ2_03055 [Halanaerobiales bacterium]